MYLLLGVQVYMLVNLRVTGQHHDDSWTTVPRPVVLSIVCELFVSFYFFLLTSATFSITLLFCLQTNMKLEIHVEKLGLCSW